MDRYELGTQIGVGSYGCVFKAKDKASQRIVAVKLIQRVHF